MSVHFPSFAFAALLEIGHNERLVTAPDSCYRIKMADRCVPIVPKAPTRRPAVAYIRASTERQEHGPKAQRDAIERYSLTHGLTLVATHADLGVSGAAPIEARPGLLAALGALTRGSVLIVAKRDRIARDVVISVLIERLAERAGASIVSVAGEGNDDASGDPSARLLRRLTDVFAEHERALISVRTKAALAAKKARGERTGSVPFGWALGADGIALVEEPTEQRTIALARALAPGRSIRAVARELDRAGARTRSGRPWDPTQVRRLINAKAPGP